jgi:transcriptional regulator with XRE-family HTH domain
MAKPKKFEEMPILDEFIKEIKEFGIYKAAKISGVSAYTLYNWTQKKAMPSLAKAQKVANAMGLEFLIFEMLED